MSINLYCLSDRLLVSTLLSSSLEFYIVPSFVAHSSVASFGLILLFISVFGRLVTFSDLGRSDLQEISFTATCLRTLCNFSWALLESNTQYRHDGLALTWSYCLALLGMEATRH